MRYDSIIPFYQKLNSNCPSDEKVPGPNPCSNNSESENKSKLHSNSILNYIDKVDSFRMHSLKIEGGVMLPNDININKKITSISNKITTNMNSNDRNKIKEYTGTWGFADVQNYLTINHKYLNESEILNGKHITEILDSAINNSLIPSGTLLWKGIENLNAKLPPETLIPGSEFEYKGFNSVSLSPDVASKYARTDFGNHLDEKDPIIVEISYSKDGKGLFLNSKSTINEKYDKAYDNRIFEVILPRNQKFKVLSVTNTKIGKVVRWEIME